MDKQVLSLLLSLRVFAGSKHFPYQILTEGLLRADIEKLMESNSIPKD